MNRLSFNLRFCKSGPNETSYYWLGLSQTIDDGLWRWHNGDVSTYSNWGMNMPSAWKRGEAGYQTCAVMHSGLASFLSTSYAWSDIDCARQYADVDNTDPIYPISETPLATGIQNASCG